MREGFWNERLFERIEALLGDRPGQTRLTALRQRDKESLKDAFYPRVYRNEVLDASYSMTANDAWETVLNLRLTTGIWWVSAQVGLVMTANFGSAFYARLYDATNSLSYSSTATEIRSDTSLRVGSMNLHGVVRIRDDYEPVRLDLDVRVDENFAEATVASTINGIAPKATNLIAWRVV